MSGADPGEPLPSMKQRQLGVRNCLEQQQRGNQTTLMASFRFKVRKDIYNDLNLQNKKGRIKERKKHFQMLTGLA